MKHLYTVDLSSWFVIAFMAFTFINGAFSSILEWLDSEDRNTSANIGRLHALGDMAKKLFTKRSIKLASTYKTVTERFSSLTEAVDSGLATLVLLFGALPTMVAHLHASFPELRMVWCWIITSSAFTTLVSLVHVPFEWYGTFHIDGRFNLNNMTPRAFVFDTLKSMVMTFVITVATALPLDWALRQYVGSDDFASIAYFFAAYVLCVTFLSPVVGWFTLPIFNKLTPLQNCALRRRLEKLCAKCGMKTPGIYVVDDSARSTKSNAFIMSVFGWKKIVLSDNLLANHTADEVEAIMAHEIGHSKLHHLSMNSILSLVSWTCGLLITLVLLRTEAFYHAFGYSWVTKENMADNFIMGYFLAASFKTAFTWMLGPLGAWHSRKLEYAADRFAVEHIKSRSSMVNALLRLYSDNLSDLFPHPLCEAATYSHPSVLNRIEGLPAKPRQARRRTTKKEGSENGQTKAL